MFELQFLARKAIPSYMYVHVRTCTYMHIIANVTTCDRTVAFCKCADVPRWEDLYYDIVLYPHFKL